MLFGCYQLCRPPAANSRCRKDLDWMPPSKLCGQSSLPPLCWHLPSAACSRFRHDLIQMPASELSRRCYLQHLCWHWPPAAKLRPRCFPLRMHPNQSCAAEIVCRILLGTGQQQQARQSDLTCSRCRHQSSCAEGVCNIIVGTVHSAAISRFRHDMHQLLLPTPCRR